MKRWLGAFVAAGAVVMALAPATSAIPYLWQNCTHVHTKYRHGVGQVSAHDRTTERPERRLRRSIAARASTTSRRVTTARAATTSTATTTGSHARSRDGTSLRSSLYRSARLLGDAQALASGNPKLIMRRAKNKLVGRTLGHSGFWRFLWR
jgi:hypothetical protein